MDLFDDLPPPGKSTKEGHAPPDGYSPFNDLSPAKDSSIGEKKMEKSAEADDMKSSAGESLFGDLPPAKVMSPGGEKRKHENTEGECTSPKVIKTDKTLTLSSTVAERKGERDEMQDAHCIEDNLLEHLPKQHHSVERVLYYGVFDGHGGARAAKHCAHNLHKHIVKHFPNGTFEEQDKCMRKCFIDSFKQTDEDFLKEARSKKPSWKDGTTAVSILVVNNVAYIANLGDSKAILCRYSKQQEKYIPLSLTKDHSPSNYDERVRIQKAGGHVKEGRVMGVLEVSRSIGDGPYKNHGVTCIPDVKRCELTNNDRFLLVACDGLWKTFTSESAIQFVTGILDDENIAGTATKSAEEVRYETACTKLANEAVRRLSADNVTVMLISIQPHNKAKS